MIRDIRRRYFEVWGDEEAQNSFLKGILVILSVLFAIQSMALAIVALRKPTSFAVGSTETKMFTVVPPSEALLSEELKRVVRRYAEVHYTWDFTTVEKAHAEAARYVAPQLVKAFNTANAEQVRIAKEKKISQKVYVADVAIDAKTLSARITMDRILMIEGLRAASSLILDINFEYGSRTSSNPEGIYISSENVVQSQ